MSLLAPLIGALGAVGGGLVTANSIDEQNQIANSQFRENMAFQRYQYEDMKRWHSPQNLVRLYRQAGLNPSLALGSGVNAPASSVGGIAPTASHVVGDYTSLPSVAGSLIQSLSGNDLNEAQQKNLEADTESKSIENQTLLRKNLAQINEMLSSKRLNDASRKQLLLQADYLTKQLNYADERLEWENQEQRYKAAGVQLDNSLKEIELLFKPLLSDAQIKQLGALAFMNYRSGQLAGKSIEKVEAETYSEWQEYIKGLPDMEMNYTQWKAFKAYPKTKAVRYALNMIFDALKAIPKAIPK